MHNLQGVLPSMGEKEGGRFEGTSLLAVLGYT